MERKRENVRAHVAANVEGRRSVCILTASCCKSSVRARAASGCCLEDDDDDGTSASSSSERSSPMPLNLAYILVLLLVGEFLFTKGVLFIVFVSQSFFNRAELRRLADSWLTGAGTTLTTHTDTHSVGLILIRVNKMTVMRHQSWWARSGLAHSARPSDVTPHLALSASSGP